MVSPVLSPTVFENPNSLTYVRVAGFNHNPCVIVLINDVSRLYRLVAYQGHGMGPRTDAPGKRTLEQHGFQFFN